MHSDKIWEDCPKWRKCNAPVCPLFPDWEEHLMLPGEKACFYLLEWSKIGGSERIEALLPTKLAEKVGLVSEKLLSSPPVGFGYLADRLKRAVKAGSRVESGKKVSKSTR